MNTKHKFLFGAAAVALTSLGAVKAQAMSVQELAEAATPVANEYGLYPSVMIAQGILESSAGQSALAVNYNNIFGVKYTSGNPVYLPTQEFLDGQMHNVVEPFQAYASVAEACAAQARLLRGSFLYSGVWRENTSSYQDATAWLQGRYATDPNYASKLNAVIAQYGLTAYDGGEVATTSTTSYVTTTTSTDTSSYGTQTYTVQEGDTVYDIAAHYGVSMDAILSQNGLSATDHIMQGQVLQIPSAGTTATTTSTTSATTMATSTVSSSYTVQSGDTLTSIASAYGRTADDLAAINGITGNIYPGQTLSV
ncbi:LysM peptidoglycan-binding domain-containing protein [Lactococcus garvieae]|jgi:LysM repeat protein|uniref:Peptidoglycan hydrolase n=1 Tax=Lactococcus formosensis TaxID=1281486 RepID=A0A9Q8Y288_9LACT|nr:glucosaminidase domain-containing protein [Lactococcus formosensis]NHI72823.1 LysM peptidoglycan-binding domain-containing protein [Lactococcus garvieae]MDT2725739.1 LysM peptidoglycan-binding domain-containing protein [Lactococcus formosensis]NHI98572.1 LysM peptidoglycan-binding domain-containing protein [Lactococcus garvieae]NHJ18237.1 LysM peptidoglycan-binding domain-containing protein [Lactococcus garvieae]USJ20717.1 LysM peptidoglycan-binding domain-containing protein [Lactococcus fo